MRRSKMKLASLLLPLFLVSSALVVVTPGYSFLPELTIPAGGGTPAANHWSMSSFQVQWNINPSIGSNVTGTTSVTTIISNSFSTWINAPNTSANVTAGATSSITQEKSPHPTINLICFVCSDVSFGGTETLGITLSTSVNGAGLPDGHGGTTQFAGQIIKADIAFNPAVTFDTGGGTGQDLRTVATHEIGHFLGLDHSAIAHAVMFPQAASVLTTLSFDDVAGISSLYPKTPADVGTGSISGTVTMTTGAPVFGAHVFANSTTGVDPFGAFPTIRPSPIGALSDTAGNFTISGVPADSYLVIAEPLDGPVVDSDIGWAAAFNQPSVQTNFTTRWH